MKQGLPIAILAVFGFVALNPAAAAAESASAKIGAPFSVADRRAPIPGRADMRNSLAAVPTGSGRQSNRGTDNTRTAQGEGDFNVDNLISTSLLEAETSGPKKRNLEFSGRTGPKLRIGLLRKRVRFALNFKLVEDVFFAPAYRLAIARADFQNPDGYWAHSIFFGMRFKFESGAP